MLALTIAECRAAAKLAYPTIFAMANSEPKAPCSLEMRLAEAAELVKEVNAFCDKWEGQR